MTNCWTKFTGISAWLGCPSGSHFNAMSSVDSPGSHGCPSPFTDIPLPKDTAGPGSVIS